MPSLCRLLLFSLAAVFARLSGNAFYPGAQLQVVRLQNCQLAIAPLQSTVTLETVETSSAESDFVEIGYISRVHGLQGEICVKPTTGFPELRFSMGLQRGTVVFTSAQAMQLIGSTLLVTEADRPYLEEGEFYTRDLVGMRVIHKETGVAIGTVVNVYNSGASDLLHVQLDSSAHIPNGNGKSKEAETGAYGQRVWVPFVEPIVPDVDVSKREMLITPPEVLLELNLRSDNMSKKERCQLEWKERKRFQKRLIAAKKKLCELEQQHVFHGFRYGEKAQGRLRGDQIVSVNSNLLQQALQNIQITPERMDLLDVTRSKVQETLEISQGSLASFPHVKKLGASFAFHESGIRLVSDGKVGIVLVVSGSENMDHSDSDSDFWSETISHILCRDDQKLVEVWVLEEEMLPVVSFPTGEEKRHKILMKSPWEILQSPVGSGGIITLFSSNNMLENLSQLGVDYIQVFTPNGRSLNGQSLLLGYMNSRGADVGIQILQGEDVSSEESLSIALSIDFVKKLINNNKIQLFAVPKLNPHVEMVDKQQWVDVVPSSLNSYEICSSLYGLIQSCPSDKVCLLHVTG